MLSSSRNERTHHPSLSTSTSRTRAVPARNGVFGVWAPGEDVAKLTYYGLYALQHRGQEAAGIAVSDGRRTVVFKDLGLVSQVFDEQVLSSLRGHLAVGHVRYSTGSTTWENAQPTFRTTATGSGLALGHNGNLVNTAELRDEVAALRNGTRHGRGDVPASTDSDLVCELLAASAATSGSRRPRCGCCPPARGVLWPSRTSRPCTPPATRTESARWCSAAWRGWVIASETAALDIVGASFVREVEPGEVLAIDADGIRSAHFAAPEPKGCIFEYVYLPAGHHHLRARRARHSCGDHRRLAHEAPVEADLVIPTPESGTPADRLRAGLGHPVRPGPGQERLRRTHVHPAQPDHPPARHPAEAQPAARRHPRQAADRRRRLHRARQHPARTGAHAARVRRARGARADRLAARALAVLLRDRLRDPGRARGQLDVEGVRCSIGADTLGYISLDG